MQKQATITNSIARLVMWIEQNTETQTYKITRDAFIITANFLCVPRSLVLWQVQTDY